MLVASDLDGTLLGPDGRLSKRTIAAVEAATDAGITVAAATGRSWRSALDRIAPAPIRYVVCSNGGLVYDTHVGDVVHHRPFAGALALSVVEAVRLAHPGAGCGWETAHGFDFDEAFLAECPTVDEVGMGEPVGPIGADTDVTKVFVCIPGFESARLQDAVRAVLPSGAQASASAMRFVEATAPGVDKGSTVAWLAAHLGVAQPDVMAMGDQLNDVSMLTWAGRSVAMGNAHEHTMATADHVTLTNAEDGAAIAIEDLTARHLSGGGSTPDLQ